MLNAVCISNCLILILVSLSKWVVEQDFRRNNKKTKFIKSYKRQEIVESHDCLYPEETWHIKMKNHLISTLIFIGYSEIWHLLTVKLMHHWKPKSYIFIQENQIVSFFSFHSIFPSLWRVKKIVCHTHANSKLVWLIIHNDKQYFLILMFETFFV